MSFVIGCDVGTQSTKAVLISDEGLVCATASESHELAVPGPGMAEQDPDHWVEAAKATIATVAAAAEGPIAGVAVDAQVDGVVAVDSSGSAVHPALIWMDRRATSHTALIEERVGADEVFEITGLNCDSSHGAPKMMWLRETSSEEIARFVPPLTFVTSWLTGEVAQDEANASSSMLFDVTTRRWSEPLLEISGLDERALPRVLKSTDPLGGIRPAVAPELGLDESVTVAVGTGDDHAAAIGAGATVPGVVADVTGTAEPIGTASATPTFDEERLLETHAHAVPGDWFIENPGFVSGGSVRWIAQVLGVTQAEVFEIAANAPVGSKGLIFIPALSGAMAPRWRDRFRGSFTGLTLDHSAAELCRAVVEGCTFAFRDNIDRFEALGLPVDQINVTGGGARSPLWLQMKADVVGHPIATVPGEGTATGAAGLAAVAAGWFPDVPAAARAFSEIGETVFEPNAAVSDTYEQAYREYRETFDAMEPVYYR